MREEKEGSLSLAKRNSIVKILSKNDTSKTSVRCCCCCCCWCLCITADAGRLFVIRSRARAREASFFLCIFFFVRHRDYPRTCNVTITFYERSIFQLKPSKLCGLHCWIIKRSRNTAKRVAACVSGYTRFDCVTSTIITLRSLGATIASFDYACIGREDSSSSRARGREPPRDYLLVRETRDCCYRRQRLHHDEREATLMQPLLYV
ncbi:unnamed protein product [Trichogramma brassicae]|uniref:Uncharacterized protein n=1 Tax=Trichogramma brassicae TaxID=86971 RepID=A0A6H5HYV2_9HYME|nr:unnamed protein product [Trichogramma brassicae]